MTQTMLVDGNNLLARASHAAQGKQVVMSHDGTSTAALVLFVNMLSKYIRLIGPTHLAVMWDAGHDFRDEIYPAYKANRTKHVEGSEDSIPFALAKEFLTWAGVPHKAHRGFEADDLIAATARQVTGDVSIVSGDKDLLQLLRMGMPGGLVVQYKVPDDEPWTATRYEEHYGCPPKHAAMVHALVGDVSDNVPGVRGLGPKRAAKLLEEAEWDWESLLALLSPEKATEAVLMRRLVDLRDCEYPEWFMEANRGCPEWSPTSLDRSTLAGQGLLDFCERYALKSIHQRLLDGSLWVEPEGPEATASAVFDGIGT